MRGLTAAQRKVLEFIAEFAQEHDRPPYGVEIQQRFGYSSTSSPYRHLLALQRKGYLDIHGGRQGSPIGIKLTPKARGLLPHAGLPILGDIAAGQPIEAIESPEWAESLADILPYQPGDFLLRVRGDSMTGAGIFPGDLVLIRPRAEIPEGKIAAVEVEGEVTLKRVHRRGGGVELISENPSYPPMRLPSVRLIGEYLGLVRQS